MQNGGFGFDIIGLGSERFLFPAEIIDIQPPIWVNEGVEVVLSAPAFDPGADDTLSYVWTVEGGPQTGADLTFTFVRPDQGVCNVQAVLSDEDDGTTTRRFQVVLENATPDVHIEPPANPFHGVQREQYVPLTLVADDSGSADSHTFERELFNALGVSLSSATTPTVVFTPLRDGPHNLVVTVTDDEGASSTAELAVEIENALPDISLDPFGTVYEGARFTMSGVIFDRIDQARHRAVIKLDSGLEVPMVLDANGRFETGPVLPSSGAHSGRIEIRDGCE
jgi:hypothetical protein